MAALTPRRLGRSQAASCWILSASYKAENGSSPGSQADRQAGSGIWGSLPRAIRRELMDLKLPDPPHNPTE